MIAIIQKFQNELTLLVLALLVLSLGVGYNNTTQEKQYDPFKEKTEKVDEMMQKTLNNPTEFNLGNAQDDIFYTYYPWAERQTGEHKDMFMAYLEACNQVLIQKSKGLDPDTTEMIILRDRLI